MIKYKYNFLHIFKYLIYIYKERKQGWLPYQHRSSTDVKARWRPVRENGELIFDSETFSRCVWSVSIFWEFFIVYVVEICFIYMLQYFYCIQSRHKLSSGANVLAASEMLTFRSRRHVRTDVLNMAIPICYDTRDGQYECLSGLCHFE